MRNKTKLPWNLYYFKSNWYDLRNSQMPIVFPRALSVQSEAKTKNQGVAGEKLAKHGIETTAVTQKKYNKNIETLLEKQIFSLLI